MISNEKRREVAQRLREVETLEYDGDVWCDECDVLDALGLYNEGDPSSCNPNNVAILSDLIDRPTCKLIENNQHRYLPCSRCGAFIRWDAVTNLTGVVPIRYCPNCGADVVDE